MRGTLALQQYPPALPLLLVRGTQDEYTPDVEWGEALAALQARREAAAEVMTLQGGDHGLRVPKGDAASVAAANEAARASVCAAVVGFVRSVLAQTDDATAAGSKRGKC